ncbi:MAG: chorismate-binding protein [Spirochaetia bacterium]|nr:chorismate-binding protein [Spirochaetia bacterium]
MRRVEWIPEKGGLSLLAWLENAPMGPKFYWKSRDGAEEWAALGNLQSFRAESEAEAKKQLEVILRESASWPEGLRAVGGMRFWPDAAPASRSPEWKEFPAFHFWIPRFELGRRGDRFFAAVNAPASEPKRSEFSLSEGGVAFSPTPDFPGTSRRDEPERSEWIGRVEDLVASIQKGTLEKAVLARKTVFKSPASFSPYPFLSARETTSEGQTLFLIESDESVFWAATPERLLSWKGNAVESDALAGTRLTEKNEELLHSAKELHEQSLVLDFLETCFGEYASDLSVGKRGLRRSGSVEHLFSRVSGKLKPEKRLSDFIFALHPTPAVGFAPKNQNAAFGPRELQKIEGFDRGWYAGAVGWFGAGAGELSVGIRSCLVQNRGAEKEWTFYTGAGITDESQAGAEWDELEAKLQATLRSSSRRPSPV